MSNFEKIVDEFLIGEFGENYSQEDAETYGLHKEGLENKVVDSECRISANLHKRFKEANVNGKLPRKLKKKLKKTFGEKAYTVYVKKMGERDFYRKLAHVNMSGGFVSKEDYKSYFYGKVNKTLEPCFTSGFDNNLFPKEEKLDVPDEIRIELEKKYRERHRQYLMFLDGGI